MNIICNRSAAIFRHISYNMEQIRLGGVITYICTRNLNLVTVIWTWSKIKLKCVRLTDRQTHHMTAAVNNSCKEEEVEEEDGAMQPSAGTSYATHTHI